MIICADTLFLAVMLVHVLVACSACSDRFFLNENRDCIACPEHCLFCDSREHCLSCENGYWGIICQRQCTDCMTGTGCEKTNGVCQNECVYGYSGIHCNIKCDTKCMNCNREHSQICVQCASGRYPAVFCNETCLGCHEQDCDETGVCALRCVNGSWGERCEQKCPQHCKYATCDRDNGTCISRCNEDLIGLQCNGTRTDSSVNDTNSALVVAIVVIITLIVLVGVLIALFVLCRKCVRKKSCQNSYPGETASLFDRAEERTTATGEERKTDNVNAVESTNKHNNRTMTTNASAGKLQPKTGRQTLQDFVDRSRALKDEDYQDKFSKLRLRVTVSVSLIEISDNSENNPESPRVDERVLFEEKVTVEIGATKADFKNARSIQGTECNTPTYFAYKGPTGQESAISRFWRKIWDWQCKLIVMLGTLSEVENEIQQYWPNKGEYVSYGRLFLKLRDEEPNETMQSVRRIIEIKEGTRVKSVTQLQFKGPTRKRFKENVQNLLEYREEVKKAEKGRGPIVVHGRADQTGTFIALDKLLNEVDDMVDCVDAKELDIFNCVDKLRKEGIDVVKDHEQYKCLHQVVSDYIEEKLRDKNEKERGGSNTQSY